MDYDYVEEYRPRFQLQSGPAVSESENTALDKKLVAVCVGVGLLLLSYAWFLNGLQQFIVGWFSISLMVGPFAPNYLTGGDCRVGLGDPLPPEEPSQLDPVETEKKRPSKGSAKKPNDVVDIYILKDNLKNRLPKVASTDELEVVGLEVKGNVKMGNGTGLLSNSNSSVKEKDWTDEEIELLQKQLLKHPRGTLKRWEVIADSFKGAHSVESVITIAKTLGERKPENGDSYSKFLAERKKSDRDIASPASQRWEVDEKESNGNIDNADEFVNGVTAAEPEDVDFYVSDWNDVEDRALLGALKSFPKDTHLRWEKVAASVPGKSKTQCIRRYKELRENFRNKKEGANESSHME